MIVNAESIELAFKGFKTVYTDAYEAATAYSGQIAMTVPSSSRDETYGWLGQFPQLREWLGGDRVVKDLQAHSFAITNRKFESTVGVSRDDFEDDRLGIFKPMFAEMGHLAKLHPDELVFGLLKDGFTTTCFDGQYFFDIDHPTKDATGADVTVSNMADGTETPWYLLDTSRAIKPMVFQERSKYDFQAVTAPSDHTVFMTDQHLYGVRARVNAGLGLWHMAFGSKQALTAANYAAARAAMQEFRGDSGRVLGIKPTVMVVPPSLEDAAMHVLNTETNDGGGSNPWKGTCDLIVTPFVA
ncbi:Mu-like prophage major head subunit gpT family protein [Sediminimonas qiaohouensis]|uniref:Mu-like prophage major head subunit gpT family protein n=1 Tax=Sediminimonas qiaohouensis TaxID=552061 RepID=UPI0003FF6DD9|nr:Mu-like prophage major head subunit gpT family protein [Sediminimonas qiaohouensis]